MILTGLRVSELTALRWRDLDLAGSKLRVVDSNTAGIRVVDLSPMLLDDLKLHRVEFPFAAPEDFVFATATGTGRHRSSVMGPIIRPAIERTNVELAGAGGSPIEGLMNQCHISRCLLSRIGMRTDY